MCADVVVVVLVAVVDDDNDNNVHPLMCPPYLNALFPPTQPNPTAMFTTLQVMSDTRIYLYTLAGLQHMDVWTHTPALLHGTHQFCVNASCVAESNAAVSVIIATATKATTKTLTTTTRKTNETNHTKETVPLGVGVNSSFANAQLQ